MEHLKDAQLRDAPANAGLVNEVTGLGKFFVKLSAVSCHNYTLLLSLGDTNIKPIWVLLPKVTKVSRGVILWDI